MISTLLAGLVATAAFDHTIKIWDIDAVPPARAGEVLDVPHEAVCMDTLRGHEGDVFCVAELADGRLASGSRDSTLRIWG